MENTRGNTDAKPTALDRIVVARVFQPQHKVQTSERVPQDPSRARVAMAQAIGEAYKRTNADGALWERLVNALANDSKAQSTASALKP